MAAAMAIASFGAAVAQDSFAATSIRFPPGQSGATVRGSFGGDRSVLYRIGAEAGQVLSIALQASNGATYFNIYAPGRGPGDEALANSGTNGPSVPALNRFSATLAVSGEYLISVYLRRSAARRGERTRFSLRVSAPSRPGAIGRPVAGDFADGLEGGPDFFAVAGIPSGDRLNLRRGPSAGAPIVARLANGARVKNLGCRMSEGARWCRVETTRDGRSTGWVSGKFLIEGSSP
jgi:hypothetical protein